MAHLDYIYNNFTRSGKKIPKKELRLYSDKELEDLVISMGCEEKFKAWIDSPKMTKFMVDGILDGKHYSWDCEYESEEKAIAAFEADGIKVEKIAKKSTHHRCKYCKGIAKGKNIDILCEQCQETFGHTYYSEL